jgi:hypothetical protein
VTRVTGSSGAPLVMHPSTEHVPLYGTSTLAIVRNPWERVVSLWGFANKVINMPSATSMIICGIKNPTSMVDFDEMVRNLDTCKFGENNWFTFATPQKAWIPNDVTYLMHLESLETDFKVIQDRFNCYEPLPYLNESIHDNYKSYYTRETWDIVAQLFKDDIDAFGYSSIQFEG